MFAWYTVREVLHMLMVGAHHPLAFISPRNMWRMETEWLTLWGVCFTGVCTA